MTINDNSTKSINAAIIDLQNQIKQLQHKIDILNKNQLKEDDIEFPGKVEYADEAGKAKEADHAKTADTAKYTSETENAVHAGYADIATKATQDASGNVITDTYATKSELTSGLSGKANTSHNHSAADITSGTLAVARGGTGQTTQADINKAIVGELQEGNDIVTDGTMFVSSRASDNGFADTSAINVPYKRKFSHVWEYIKGKISSVLGLTASNYGGKASTAGTADRADSLARRGSIQNTDTFQPIMNNDGKWIITDLTPDWKGSLYTLNAGGSQSGLMFRIVGGANGSNQVQMNYSIDGSRFGMNWATLINSGNIGAQTVARATQDGNGNVITSTYALKSELENTFQDHLIGYIRNKPIYRKVILDSTAYNVHYADINLINLGGSNRKFIRSGGYVKYSINGTNYRTYPINSKTCAVEIFEQDGFVYLESTNVVVGTNIDIYAWIDYMQS